jgi:hypothetical protein
MRHPEKVMKLASTGANVQPDASGFGPGVWVAEKNRYDADKNKVWNTEKK